MENNEKKSHGLGKFLAGAAVGVGLGVLFAPKSGKETRKELKEKFEEMVKKVKEIDLEEVRESFLNKIDEIKKDLADLDKEKVLEIAKEKATPVIQKAVDDLRVKTIAVLKDTVNKLEDAKEPKKAAKKSN